MSNELPKAYNPKEVEDKIYKLWEESGYFTPENLPGERNQKFVTAIAPPNITGELHMGHALELTMQDILVRLKRMQGYKTLWIPGIDHAGIAAQNVVEKQLKKEGMSRHDLGREKFEERVQAWKEKYGTAILGQFKKLGISVDWSRTRYTRDERYEKAVREAFRRYHEKGWIYKGFRVINWCIRCGTGISDLEVNYVSEKGKLYFIKYGPFTLATTRPETKLGDTALAVHQEDPRYKNRIGEKLTINTIDNSIPCAEPPKLKKIEIQIVGDEAVDPEFGTGIIKVTPAHDMTDFEIGQRHGLPIIKVIGELGRMTEEAGMRYHGMKVAGAREQITKDLQELGLLEKIEDYDHNVGRCDRCDSVIEPLPSYQWFLKVSKLAQFAREALENNETQIFPQNWRDISLRWIDNMRDWNISRQLWWGHKIPIFYDIKDAKNAAGEIKFGLSGFEVTKEQEKILENKFPGDIMVGSETINNSMRRFLIAATFPQINYILKNNWKNWEEIKSRAVGLINTGELHVVLETEQNSLSSLYIQEFDVLDTWFSSALWPFAVLDWPENTKDLEDYYPTQFITSDRGIVFLWQIRMIFSGKFFTGKSPFERIYIHPTVLTKDGRRMSKSLGTGIDPVGLIEKYGTDALRFGLA